MGTCNEQMSSKFENDVRAAPKNNMRMGSGGEEDDFSEEDEEYGIFIL